MYRNESFREDLYDEMREQVRINEDDGDLRDADDDDPSTRGDPEPSGPRLFGTHTRQLDPQ